jgi:hypothetical protein
MKRPDVWIQIRVCPAATTVELNDVGEAGQTAIVHIGRCLSDLAQRGCLERPTMAIPACDCGAACVQKASITPCDAGVVKILIASAAGPRDTARSVRVR